MLTNDSLWLFKNNEHMLASLNIEDFLDNPLVEWAESTIVLVIPLNTPDSSWALAQTETGSLFDLKVVDTNNDKAIFEFSACRIINKTINNIVPLTPDDLGQLYLICTCVCEFRINVD